MNRIAIFAFVVGVTAESYGDSLHLVGERFQPTAPVIWAATNVLPKTLTVYKVLPQQLSETVMSNAMSMALFKPVNRFNSDKNSFQFRDNRDRPTRFLNIVPSAGWIWYLDEMAIAQGASPPKGVPTNEEVDKLASHYRRIFGIATNDLSFHPQYRTDQRRTNVDKKGNSSGAQVCMRGVSYPRLIDGIAVGGGGVLGGFSIQFGNSAKVHGFEMVWRNFQPDQKYETASPDGIIATIKAGLAVKPAASQDLSQAKKFTVVNITPFYEGRSADEPQSLMYPLAVLEVFADVDTNKVHFYLQCPIISTEVKPK